jgi:hypothetical protein
MQTYECSLSFQGSKLYDRITLQTVTIRKAAVKQKIIFRQRIILLTINSYEIEARQIRKSRMHIYNTPTKYL